MGKLRAFRRPALMGWPCPGPRTGAPRTASSSPWQPPFHGLILLVRRRAGHRLVVRQGRSSVPMPNQRAIAKAAGVNQATVSLALRNSTVGFRKNPQEDSSHRGRSRVPAKQLCFVADGAHPVGPPAPDADGAHPVGPPAPEPRMHCPAGCGSGTFPRPDRDICPAVEGDGRTSRAARFLNRNIVC